MFYRAISLVLVAVLLHGSIAAQDQTQSPPQTVARMQQVLRKAQQKDKAVKVALKKRIDHQKKFSGKVSDISDTGFVVADQKTGKTQKLAYEDVQEITPKGMPKAAEIAIGVGILVGVVAAIFWALYPKT
jgi:cytochrome bd-type quinol oxidase subunit 1